MCSFFVVLEVLCRSFLRCLDSAMMELMEIFSRFWTGVGEGCAL